MHKSAKLLLHTTNHDKSIAGHCYRLSLYEIITIDGMKPRVSDSGRQSIETSRGRKPSRISPQRKRRWRVSFNSERQLSASVRASSSSQRLSNSLSVADGFANFPTPGMCTRRRARPLATATAATTREGCAPRYPRHRGKHYTRSI